MSLEGSIDTVALPDLLRLLAGTKKTGQLRVHGDHVLGQLWLDDGDLIGYEVGRARTHLDAVFELLRVPTGMFSFNTGTIPPADDAVPLLGLLDGALSRLSEWREIQRVVPSLASVIRLTAELRGSEATIGADQWRLIAAVASASSVLEILERLDLKEFDGCRDIRELVEIGLLHVEDQVEEVALPAERFIELTASVERAPEAARQLAVDPPHPDSTETDDPPEGPVEGFVAAMVRAPAPTAEPVRVPTSELDPVPAAGMLGGSDGTRSADESDVPLSRGAVLNFLSSMRP